MKVIVADLSGKIGEADGIASIQTYPRGPHQPRIQSIGQVGSRRHTILLVVDKPFKLAVDGDVLTIARPL